MLDKELETVRTERVAEYTALNTAHTEMIGQFERAYAICNDEKEELRQQVIATHSKWWQGVGGSSVVTGGGVGRVYTQI